MPNVVVTGFGKFRVHKVNASWEAIKDGQLTIDRPNINVITREVMVSYKEVDRVVAGLWEEYKPVLMVHVGLAEGTDSIKIEQLARHGPYLEKDVVDHAPHEELRKFCQPQMESGEPTGEIPAHLMHELGCSRSYFSIGRVCDKLNSLGQVPIKFSPSENAGLFVCEYIYQTSLRICDRAVFIHVPNTDKCPLHVTRSAIKLAIEALIDELNEVH